jgi:phage-related protein
MFIFLWIRMLLLQLLKVVYSKKLKSNGACWNSESQCVDPLWRVFYWEQPCQKHSWTPQKGYSVERTPNVAVVKLGDGYEQRQTKGINPLMDKYSLTFTGVDDAKCSRPNAAKAADAFLKRVWRCSLSTGRHLILECRSCLSADHGALTKTGPLYELTATFEQVR